MNTTTYGIESPSGEGIQVVSETVFVGNPEEYLSEKCCPAMTLEEVMDARGSAGEWTAINTPSSSPTQTGSPVSHRMTRQRQRASVAEFTKGPVENVIQYYELLIETIEAERDSANDGCQKAVATACTESERLEQQLCLADCAAESARNQATQEMALLKEKASQDYEKMSSARDQALQDLSEAKAQIATIEKRGHDHSSCQEFRSLDEHHRALSQITDLEAEVERLARDFEEAQGSVTAYKNSFAITDKILKEQHAEIVEQKAKIVEQKAKIMELNVEITCLGITIAEPQGAPDPPLDNKEGKEMVSEDSAEHTGAGVHSTLGHPLVMRIDVWVGGEHGTDTELALVKMNPDTPFKVVLEDLHHHHPLKALKQKDTGRYIFDSDTPAHLGVKDGEEFVFIQQNDEPMYMLDATFDGANSWRGKDSRV